MEELLAKRGTFVAGRYSDLAASSIARWCAHRKIPSARAAVDRLHTTILFSRTPVEAPEYQKLDRPIKVYAKELVIWNITSSKYGNTNALILLLDSPQLLKMHREFCANGGTHDYDDYIPHMTLSYNVGAAKIEDFGPFPRMVFDMVSLYSEELAL